MHSMRVVAVLFVALALGAQSVSATAFPAGAKRMTTASAVRLRAEPNTSARIVDTLSVGVELDELERSSAPQTIGGVEEYWYRVNAPGGKTGWVFGGFARAFDPQFRDDVHAEITRARLEQDADKLAFTDWADLYTFLNRVASKTGREDLRAELELARLLAMQRALGAVKIDEQEKEPYRSFISKLGYQANYSEPSAEWLVAGDLFWKLYEQYPRSPISERIAWEAANNPLPGECETDIGCHLYSMAQGTGRYLTLYPSGKNAQSALEGMDEMMTWVVEIANSPDFKAYLDDAEWRADLLKNTKTLRETVAKTSGGAKRESLLTKLAEVEKRVQ